MSKFQQIAFATRAMNESMDAKRMGNTAMAQERYQAAMAGLDAIGRLTDVKQARQTMQIQRAGEERTQQMFPSQLQIQEQAAGTGQIELGREQRLEQAYQTIAQERGEPIEVIKARAEALETEARVPAAQEQIQRFAERRRVSAVPAEVQAEAATTQAGLVGANLATKSADALMAEDFPKISAAAKAKMAQIEPVQAQKQIDALTERILTEAQTRDPAIAQIKANIAFTKAKTTQLGEAQSKDWRALLNMYQYLAKLKADDYALKTYGRTTAELEVDRLQGRGEMTKEDAIRLYIQLLRMSDPMSDPNTMMMWKMFGIEQGAQDQIMQKRDQLMERLNKFIQGQPFSMEVTPLERAREADTAFESFAEPSPAQSAPTPTGEQTDVDAILDAFEL